MEQKSILIYDDDQDFLEIAKYFLGKEYQVEALSSCKNLFKDIERIQPDLILIDLVMRETRGEQVIELLHANDDTKKIPVLVFSAADDLPKKAKKMNARGVIEKPFSMTILMETVKKYIL